MNDKEFRKWENEVFGYGYGTGEAHTVRAVKAFFAACPAKGNYDYSMLENELSPVVFWLLLNIFAHADIIEYGTSPRFGWLTSKGKQIQNYVLSKTDDELYEIVTHYDPEEEEESTTQQPEG